MSVSIHYRSATAGWLAKMDEAGVPVYVWTVNPPDRWTWLAPRVDAIITNDPRGFARYRAESG